jgi:hypothetical protein
MWQPWVARVGSLLALVGLLACGGAGGGGEVRPEVLEQAQGPDLPEPLDVVESVDTIEVFDAAEAGPPPGPSLRLHLLRAEAATAFPAVAVEALGTGSDGLPVAVEASLSATQPDGYFQPTVEPVLSGRAGTWWRVSAGRAGEVTITARAEVEGLQQEASETVVFLPFVAPGWGVVRAVSELNTRGHEDSMSLSPDGRTLFFAYTPLENCNVMPAGWGDPPDKPECLIPFGPVGTPERACAQGLGDNGNVSPGLFGDQDTWPWVKGMYCAYVALRGTDGRFGTPSFVSFNDDGALLEVSPSSGPENPEPGQPFHLFFGYPDWLDLDPERDGSIYAVATVTAGQATLLGSPITAFSSPPADLGITGLTGPMNLVRESSASIGEFRVFDDPTLGARALWFERREAADTSLDLVRSPLTGTWPVGDWGPAEALPAPVNTPTHDESFPWLVTLDDPQGPRLHLFFSRGKQDFTADAQILDAARGPGDWDPPQPVLASDSAAPDGGVFLVATPSVTRGPFGVELFFHYVIRHPDRLDFQIGVVARD